MVCQGESPIGVGYAGPHETKNSVNEDLSELAFADEAARDDTAGPGSGMDVAAAAEA